MGTVKVLKKTELTRFTSKSQKEGKWFRVLFVDRDRDFVEAISFDENKYEELQENGSYELQSFEVKQPDQ